MADETNISWADMTFNPVIGCTRVSPACDGCYAAHLMETRMGRVVWGGPGVGAGTRERTSDANWRKPLTWNRAAIKAGTRPFVFCASLADVFDSQWDPEWRRDLFDLIRATPNLVWLLLTKRPQLIVKLADAAGGLPANAALGTTCEDQKRYDHNSEHLRAAKIHCGPAFTFGSFEPLLGPINLGLIAGFDIDMDWVITGGETDQGAHKARPTNPDWERSLRGQCATAGIPFHKKQTGEWVPAGHRSIVNATENLPVDHSLGRLMVKVGKHRSGRDIDGIEHNAFPAVRRVA